MQIQSTHNTNFNGLLQINPSGFCNTDKIVGIDKDEKGVFAFLNHSERPHAKPGDYCNDLQSWYYDKICSDAFYRTHFPQNISLEQALKNYSLAAAKPENVVNLDGKLLA